MQRDPDFSPLIHACFLQTKDTRSFNASLAPGIPLVSGIPSKTCDFSLRAGTLLSSLAETPLSPLFCGSDGLSHNFCAVVKICQCLLCSYFCSPTHCNGFASFDALLTESENLISTGDFLDLEVFDFTSIAASSSSLVRPSYSFMYSSQLRSNQEFLQNFTNV